MAILMVSIRVWVLAVAVTYVSVLCSNLGKADEAVPQTGGAGYDIIYSNCEESYRLSESGNLNVPPQKTDEYCGGSCLIETNLVLNCIDNIFAHFVFYNKATIQDVGDTVKAACGNGPERGNFNVAEHIQAEKSNAYRAINHILYGLGLMIVGLESYRLSESGNLNVPPQKTDEYCGGSCLIETNLVLNCIDNIFAHFVFYNKATIQDVGDTVKAACGNGPERGSHWPVTLMWPSTFKLKRVMHTGL
ncbi:hypothetical protein CFP56_025180 [Quercus suber]|uniref:DUF7731 domain-containing protein n=1 Tax=Quercus suber TaxID=58331 RepID=A0AAW0K5N8_QUESU